VKASSSPKGRVIVLNGPSSAGKSSLAQALQHGFAEPHLHVQLDAFRAMEPTGYFGPEQSVHGALRLAALCRAMNATSAQYARHGQHVLLDHVLPPIGWRYLAEDLAEYQVFLVGVGCDLPQLQARESHRGDRPPGLAASQAATVHKDTEYDFMVDTSGASAQECASAIFAWFASGPSPAAFAKLVQRHATA
jgi:chloramphenicol 3-O phosphotransferase